jgi:hypothetical protein
VQAQRASPATVKGRCGADDFNSTIGLADTFIAHFVSPNPDKPELKIED